MIVTFPNDILTASCAAWDYSNPPEDPQQLVTEMLTIMNDSRGVGLSAPQIGKPYRVFVMRGDPNFACFNPLIVNYSADHSVLDEACLSLPSVVGKVKRSNKIRVRFHTASGGTVTKTFEGLTARVFQHEYDHLNGVLMIHRMNRYHRDKAMKGYSYAAA